MEVLVAAPNNKGFRSLRAPRDEEQEKAKMRADLRAYLSKGGSIEHLSEFAKSLLTIEDINF
jgi:hypothetical protein